MTHSYVVKCVCVRKTVQLFATDNVSHIHPEKSLSSFAKRQPNRFILLPVPHSINFILMIVAVAVLVHTVVVIAMIKGRGRAE